MPSRRLHSVADRLAQSSLKNLVQLDSAYLVADDSTLDQPDGPHIELVIGHWPAKHRAVVEVINLITLWWTDGDFSIPVDW